ncbi:DUF4313 domain-containing protein [Niallia taxi]|uniref:DUF4313 domain-containing protein n=1 Tax=Niallia taxi TaxID=2499688 RepID=UPI0015F3674E|nr:DUF4313 domain-containing protein [Niallia taxi]
MKVVYAGTECNVEKLEYEFGSGIAIDLIRVEDEEELYVCATVNVRGSRLEKDEVLIDVNNAEGLLEVLEAAGVVKATGRMVNSGFCTYPVCKVLI